MFLHDFPALFIVESHHLPTQATLFTLRHKEKQRCRASQNAATAWVTASASDRHNECKRKIYVAAPASFAPPLAVRQVAPTPLHDRFNRASKYALISTQCQVAMRKDVEI
jgi:hypothetical protein